MRKIISEAESLEDVSSRFVERFETLGARVTLSGDNFAIVTLNLNSLLRRLARPVFCIVSTAELTLKALKEDGHWLDSIITEKLPGRSSRSGLVPIVLSGRQFSIAISALQSSQILASEQPIISFSVLEAGYDPGDTLRAVLLKTAPIRALTPYGVATATPQNMLFGRQKEIRQILQSRSDKITITGPRRIGKTSLVTEIQRRSGTISLGIAGFHGNVRTMNKCALVDVSDMGVQASTRIWQAILKGFNLEPRDYRARGRFAKFARSSKRFSAREDLVDEAKSLAATIHQFNGELTIILDEVDSWVRSEAARGWSTLDQLRAMTDGKAKVILVGYETLLLAAENHRFPLAGRGINSIQLGPLDRESHDQLISLPMKELGITIESKDQFLNRCWATTSGMPNLIQDICFHLVDISLGGERKTSRIGMQELQAAIGESSALELFKGGVVHCDDFPLAEAIAGITSLGGVVSDPKSEPTTETSFEPNEGGMRIDDIVNHLQKYGYLYDSSDVKLALAYLQLRFMLSPVDSSKSRWSWRNQLARRTMATAVQNTGVSRFLNDAIRRHKDGEWRSTYQALRA